MPDPPAALGFDPGEYWEHRLSGQYSLGSTGWASLGESFNRWSYAVRALAFRRIVGKVIRDVARTRVLDIGSGTGFYVRQWQRLGARDVAASDLTSVAVQRLRQRFPGSEAYQLDIGESDLATLDGPYGAISAMDVLFHIVADARYERALMNLAGLLEPGGMLILTENPAPQRREGKHQIVRTRTEIEIALARAGLAVVRESPIFFLMNTPVSPQDTMLLRWWELLCRAVRRHEGLGWVLGAGLFPVEVTLGRWRRSGPSTTIIAARRSGSRGPGDAASATIHQLA